ncbi:hypothetical protein LEP1GSC151_2152 [Leptospira interrogans serovar Grippotyphosa str. LT2186]|uniref:Uncharacterized protein n=2 Tax=Leptospira interrogans TaxID=173 RepID=M3HBP1_LEPIR|nr:hypothetical protein [Leptospira interrogans]EMG10120.1 hypothetical protein LEP1GSC151_2152 [Leptospira interrogans serovar Grippotyphosa str. LT2186]EKO89355.1 hypothetical protein LEP1GSC009_2800 [Leptospira interrogans serovar Grippotyphosa str. Andaman]EKP87376.1 hypothetical protein LEP1GSC020_0835 [Leptospira interrogans serovar Grippotyphosa str. 2006006986]EKR44727.1 hypothetical protein LEP1GSC097_0299 [Leptospira interrogans serovar Grippotyphosa str. UI 08368]EMN86514.1 hypothet
MYTKLQKIWKDAAENLNLEVEIPFSIILADNLKINVSVLLKNFGAKNGMLIITNYEDIEPYLEKIYEAGYGFSTLSEPSENEQYLRKDFIELLSDWGWTGDVNLKPEWL